MDKDTSFNWKAFHHELAKELYVEALNSPGFTLENLDATVDLCVKLANKFVDAVKNNEERFGY